MRVFFLLLFVFCCWKNECKSFNRNKKHIKKRNKGNDGDATTPKSKFNATKKATEEMRKLSLVSHLTKVKFNSLFA